MTDETTEFVTVRADEAGIAELLAAGGGQAVRVGWDAVRLPAADAASVAGVEYLEGDPPSTKGRKATAKKEA